MKILRVSDRVSIKANGIELLISPLSYAQKIEISNCVKMDAGNQMVDIQKTAMLTLAYSIKSVKGVTTFSDSDYELEFTDESKTKLTEECTGELIAVFASTNLFGIINSVLSGKLEVENAEGVTIEVLPKGK
jgi:hypothetical protein